MVHLVVLGAGLGGAIAAYAVQALAIGKRKEVALDQAV